MSLKSICVFCGSASGHHPAYADAMAELAQRMAQRQLTLVNGGGSVGLMGVGIDTILAAGGRAIGIIPERLMRREVGHKTMSELHVVSSMHERKALMSELSDAYIAAPGGIGTFEELFEVFTWKQIGYHDKPIVLLNTLGYYDGLLRFLEDAVAQGFLQPATLAMLGVAATPTEALDWLAAQAPARTDFAEHRAAT